MLYVVGLIVACGTFQLCRMPPSSPSSSDQASLLFALSRHDSCLARSSRTAMFPAVFKETHRSSTA